MPSLFEKPTDRDDVKPHLDDLPTVICLDYYGLNEVLYLKVSHG